MSDTRVHIGGDVFGQVVVGDHNITVWAEQSVVTVVGPAARPQPVRRPVVTLLPRRPARPFGRDRELATLLDTNVRLGQVFGPPGVGKSTLLRYAASRFGADTVYLTATGRAPDDLLQDVFEACFDVVGYRPSPIELRRLMSDVDIRLVIDDLDLPDDQRAELLDGVPDATVIFTSVQRALWADGTAWQLTGLAWAPALALLTAALNRPLTDAEQLTAAHLWQAADGSPLLLLRAAAGIRPGPDGVMTLPTAAELADLLPRILANLTPTARTVVSVLALTDAVVSDAILPWLVPAPDGLPGAVAELAVRGMVIATEHGCQLAPGVAAALPADLLADVPQLDRLADRLRESARHLLRPADDIPFIAGVIDATVRLGRADIGAALAKDIAPVLACSGRLGAWERILDRGRAAAQAAGDRSILAYLTHEDGIRALVTGNRLAAAAAIAAAIALWQEVGALTRVAIAQQTQTLTGMPAPAPTVAVAVAAAAKSATVATKTGLAVGAKVAIAAAATVAVAVGGYFGVTALRGTDHQTALPPAAARTHPTSTVEQPTSSAKVVAPTKKGVVPADCPTDPYLGKFDGHDSLLERSGPGLVACDYEKGAAFLVLGLFPGPDPQDTGARPIAIVGTDDAWVSSPDSSGVGSVSITVGERSLKMQYVGSTDDAVAAAKRVVGLSG